MYNILVIGAKEKGNEKSKHKFKFITSKELWNEIEKGYYDFIYCKQEDLEKDIENKLISNNYMLIPKCFEIMTERITDIYINMDIVNNLIINNIKIIEFENWLEKIAVESILKEFIIESENTKKIYYNLYPNLWERIKIKRIINKVIKRDYNVTNFFRRCKYFIMQKRIKEKFWEILIKNVKNDIKAMEKI